jgi:hypothetical protein
MLTVDDKRHALRHRVLKEGKIVLLNNWSVVDCCVRDISDTGARLRCKDQVAVPQEFRLLLAAENTIRDCTVVWRRDDLIGVQFTSEPRRAPPRKW